MLTEIFSSQEAKDHGIPHENKSLRLLTYSTFQRRCNFKIAYSSGEIILQSFPEKLWLPPPWQCSRPGWMGLWAAWSGGRCPCLWQWGWSEM